MFSITLECIDSVVKIADCAIRYSSLGIRPDHIFLIYAYKNVFVYLYLLPAMQITYKALDQHFI